MVVPKEVEPGPQLLDGAADFSGAGVGIAAQTATLGSLVGQEDVHSPSRQGEQSPAFPVGEVARSGTQLLPGAGSGAGCNASETGDAHVADTHIKHPRAG